jgi:hypothetical protein
MSFPAVRYMPGAPIDPSKTLDVIDLPVDYWELLERAYPELTAAGPHAAFRRQRSVAIFPPQLATAPALAHLAGSFAPSDRATMYRREVDGKLTGLLVYVQGQGAFASLHIFRLK